MSAFSGKILFALSSNILGGTAQGVSMPLWLDRAGDCADPFVVFLITTIWYPTLFFISAMFHNWFTKSSVSVFNRYTLRQHFSIACVGCFDALNGVFVVLASPPDRTPPVISALLGGGLVMLLMVPIKHLYMQKNQFGTFNKTSSWKIYNHPSFRLFVLFTLFACYLTIYVPIRNHADMNHDLYWWSIFLIGLIFGSFYNVQQELFFKQESHSTLNHFLNYVFWQTFYLCLWGHFFTWSDLIPGFGNSTKDNIHCNFNDTYVNSFTTSGGFGYSFMFNAGYYISYIASCYINKEDALIGTIASVVTNALVIAISFPINELTPDRSVVEIGLLPINFLMGAFATYYYTHWSKSVNSDENQFNNNENNVNLLGEDSGDRITPGLETQSEGPLEPNPVQNVDSMSDIQVNASSAFVAGSDSHYVTLNNSQQN